MMWVTERLSADHDLQKFSCGKPIFDEWLRHSALALDDADQARTFVWTDQSKVIAFYTLVPHEIRRDSRTGRRISSGAAAAPALFLSSMALDQRLQGKGLGGRLLVDAIARSIVALEKAEAGVIVADAIDGGARAFYQHFGFTPLSGAPFRLAMRARDARSNLTL